MNRRNCLKTLCVISNTKPRLALSLCPNGALFWWRRRESNPRPKAICRQSLRVYQVVLIELGTSTCKLPEPPADFCFALPPSAREESLARINDVSLPLAGEEG